MESRNAESDSEKFAFQCLVEVEQFLRHRVSPVARSAGVRLKKTTKSDMKTMFAPGIEESGLRLECAGDLLGVGKSRGWIA